MDARHPYELISLFTAGLVLGLLLIACHVFMLMQPDASKTFLKRFPRNELIGQILIGLGMAWFWLLVAPDGLGMFSALQMDFGEFNAIKPMLRILIPFIAVAVCVSIRDFLAVRALGLLGLMAAAPLLEAAFLEDPVTRLLIPIYAYLLLSASLFWVGMPFLFRDAVTWVSMKDSRWKLLTYAGLGYGILVLACTVLFWRGY